MNFDEVSAKVFPMQILFPPKKGAKAKVFLFFPLGAKKYLLVGSNLSGMYLSGSIQYSGFLWS